MAVSLGDHFSAEFDDATYAFGQSVLVATSARNDLIDALATLMATNKADPDVTDDLLAAAGWTAAAAPLRKGNIQVRRGDFAEVLAAEAAESVDGLTVPIRKLRYQIDPNQTLPGSDVVAFVLDDSNAIDDLEFVESKYRTNPALDIAVEAHEQLSTDRELGYGTTLNFIAHRLRDTKSSLYDAFMSFLASRGVKDCAHTVALAFDSTNWDDEIAANLDDLPEHLPALHLRLFSLESAADLIEDVYAAMAWDVIDDE